MPKPLRRRATPRQGRSARLFGLACAHRPLRCAAGPTAPHRTARRGGPPRIDPAHTDRSSRYSLKTLKIWDRNRLSPTVTARTGRSDVSPTKKGRLGRARANPRLVRVPCRGSLALFPASLTLLRICLFRTFATSRMILGAVTSPPLTSPTPGNSLHPGTTW